MTLEPSTSIRSNDEKSARSSSSFSLTCASPAFAIASITMLRKCCQQSPRYTRYFSSRSSLPIASQASLPTFASIVCMTASASLAIYDPED